MYVRALGLAPWLRATRSQSTAESDPVTARFGPRLSPIRSARAWAGTSTASSIDAGRLFSPIAAIAPAAAVCQRSNELTRFSGPCHQRPIAPTATASTKSPPIMRGSTAAYRRARVVRASSTTTIPTTSTGSAGEASASTSTVETATPARPRPMCALRALGRLRGRPAERAPEREGHEQRRDDDRSDRGGPHAGEERQPRNVLVMQHDQVRQVRPRQEERRRVRHEDGAVEERRLVDPAVPREMQQHRRQEEDGRVEVEHRRHERDEPE